MLNFVVVISQNVNNFKGYDFFFPQGSVCGLYDTDKRAVPHHTANFLCT